MTSPYSMFKNNGGLALQTGAAGQGNSQPQWIELFDQKYQYYHVAETEWEITINFGTPNNGVSALADNLVKNFGYYVFWKYTNEDDPPTQYVIDNGSIANAGAVGAVNANQIGTTATAAGAVTLQMTPDDYFRIS